MTKASSTFGIERPGHLQEYMPVALASGSGEKRRKEIDVTSGLRPAQRWVVDQKSWSPLERKARRVGDKSKEREGEGEEGEETDSSSELSRKLKMDHRAFVSQSIESGGYLYEYIQHSNFIKASV